MSLDVFGRKLGSSSGGRGPPGIGYKLTSDGHYDVDNKRICNVAAPSQASDAANVQTVKNLITMELKEIRALLKGMREEVDNLNVLEEALRDEHNEEILKLKNKFDKLLETIGLSEEDMDKTWITKYK